MVLSSPRQVAECTEARNLNWQIEVLDHESNQLIVDLRGGEGKLFQCYRKVTAFYDLG